MVSDVLLPQLVDLSIGTPEIGAVNFNALHKLLHAIVKSIKVSELESQVDKAFPSQKDAAAGKQDATGSSGKTLLLSLEEKVSSLENDLKVLYPKLPNAKEMSSLIKSDQPIADLWHLLALTKKVEANATGVQTAMNLIQELFDQLKTVTKSLDTLTQQVNKSDLDSAGLIELKAVSSKVKAIESEVGNLGVVKQFFGESYPSLMPTSHVATSDIVLQSTKLASASITKPTKTIGSKSEAGVAKTITSVTSNAIMVSPQPEEVPKLGDIMEKLSFLESAVSEGAIVTWPRLEDALNGVHTPYTQTLIGPSSPHTQTMDGTPSPHTQTQDGMPPPTTQTQDGTPPSHTQTQDGTPPPNTQTLDGTPPPNTQTDFEKPLEADVTKGKLSVGVESFAKFPKAPLLGPSDDCLDMLEKLGSSDGRIKELTEQVKHLSDVVTGPDGAILSDQTKKELQLLRRIAPELADIEGLKSKLNDLEVLLSDIPEAEDEHLPVLGDKSRLSLTNFGPSRRSSHAPMSRTRPNSFMMFDRVNEPLGEPTAPSPSVRNLKRQPSGAILDSQGGPAESTFQRTKKAPEDFSPSPLVPTFSVTKYGNAKRNDLAPGVASLLAVESEGSPVHDQHTPTPHALAKKKLDKKAKSVSQAEPKDSSAEAVFGVHGETVRNALGAETEGSGSQPVSDTAVPEASSKPDAQGSHPIAPAPKVSGLKAEGNKVSGSDTSVPQVLLASGTQQRKSQTDVSKPSGGGVKSRAPGFRRSSSLVAALQSSDSQASESESQSSVLSEAMKTDSQELGANGHQKLDRKIKNVEKTAAHRTALTDRGKPQRNSLQKVATPKKNLISHSILPQIDSFGSEVTGDPNELRANGNQEEEEDERVLSSVYASEDGQTSLALPEYLLPEKDRKKKTSIIPERTSQQSDAPDGQYRSNAPSVADIWNRAERRSIKDPDNKPFSIYDSRPKTLMDDWKSEGTRSAADVGQLNSLPDVAGRFNRTLREVVQRDYMPEIRRLHERINRLENRPAYQIDVNDSGKGYRDSKVFEMLQRLDALRDETDHRVQEMNKQLHSVLEHGPIDEESLRRTQIALGDLQAQLLTVRSLTLQLKAENEQAAVVMKEMKLEFARLEEEKVDNQTMAAHLYHKANLTDLADKVDREKLETITFDLHKLIDDLLAKLAALESAWKKAHQKLESDVDAKISEESMMKMKNAIEKKMKRLHQKIKEQQSLLYPSADEAAGLRRRLPFNCLSCDKPVAGFQYCVGDNLSLNKLGPHALKYSQSDLDQLNSQTMSPRESCDRISLSHLGKKNLKAYVVHLCKEQQPKVFITRSKTRMTTPGVADVYAKPRACGGKHTITQNKLQGQIVQPGRTQSLKDVLATEEFVAAGVLKQEEQVLKGADGRTYRSRNDTIQVDGALTQAIRTNKDPSLPIVEELKLPNSLNLSKTTN